ncbi:hypothetical protein J7355_16370 [Endozoicomonas sp. G2_2]|uniref:hypothetical protein n=1 Tax=Endozoicomonas sp. G2_2 TaxID=2821092 RepID=UPI001ADB1707|nr:hypothetical protein [Endozoicomonas sp. G2_2]MBO9471666.1 hypothetical protein [Endozoicomonas sp. G2_2]
MTQRNAAAYALAPGALTTLLTGATLLYLLCELAFNAALIDAVSDHHAADLERIGRLLAGCGAGLMLLRLFRPTRPRRIAATFAAGLAAGYIAQYAILEMALGSVTDQQRKDAPDILLLEQALADRIITLDGLDPAIVESRAAYLSFVTLLGYTSWSREADIATIAEHRGRLRQRLALDRAHTCRLAAAANRKTFAQTTNLCDRSAISPDCDILDVTFTLIT